MGYVPNNGRIHQANVWKAKLIVHDVEVRGFVILNLANLASQDEDAVWRAFMRTAIDNQLRIWIAIGTGSFTTLAALVVLLGVFVQRVHLPTAFLLPLELLSSLSMATAFGATLSLTLRYPTSLPNPNSSMDLASFAILLPISRAYAIGTGTGMFLGFTATFSFLIQTIHRVRDSKACSFEPTASTLGMGYEYQVSAMQESRTLSPVQDEEKGLAEAGASMGRRDSLESRTDGSVNWPQAVAKRMDAVNIRPHRPWSEMPKP